MSAAPALPSAIGTQSATSDAAAVAAVPRVLSRRAAPTAAEAVPTPY